MLCSRCGSKESCSQWREAVEMLGNVTDVIGFSAGIAACETGFLLKGFYLSYLNRDLQ